MTAQRAGLLFVTGLVALLSGCASLPQGAAMRTDITRDADTTGQGFAFYPVTRALLPSIEAWPQVNPELSSGWPHATRGSTGQVIAPGDIVNVTIWDNQENSLILADGQRATKLDGMAVSPSGRVFIPYVGDVRVAGMSPDRARGVLQDRLVDISPSAQVQLTLVAGRQNTVDLVSGVSSPGSYPLPDGNFSVLSLISQGGGVPPSLRNPRVKLLRGSRTYLTTVDRLYSNPELDAVLTGGDKVIVEQDDRFFLSLGAAGKEQIVYFDRDQITALEAISMIGGLTDSRADPEGVLILREYPRSALSAGVRGPREQRVVFAIDMTTADGLFSARNMLIQPGDVVLATESPVTRVQTIVGLIGSGFGLIRAANNAGN
ncbi:polysaccharide biosynthesis/export family protein [Oceaniglobus roseus]|uniref:polysaccharide biosynthesis/export family protein n=1 Tax=Oceaniglobus roseus TaxID=1737570 RepID=UPI000C7F19E1|nr:polysaccharide biosynthesis/export family protein [Kandeliimicrobium roseum]